MDASIALAPIRIDRPEAVRLPVRNIGSLGSQKDSRSRFRYWSSASATAFFLTSRFLGSFHRMENIAR
jgi:hypothetical protein